jgi:hypothetical protein
MQLAARWWPDYNAYPQEVRTNEVGAGDLAFGFSFIV